MSSMGHRQVPDGTPVRTALVSGGSGAIGSAIVQRLVANGANCHVIDLAPRDIKAATYHVADVSSEDDCVRTVREIGRVDILVNCAGMHPGHVACWEMESGLFERVAAVNLFSAYYLCRSCLPQMMANGWGRIVSIASIAAREGVAGSSAYCASKAAMVGLMSSLAKECGHAGVLVNSVLPGSIESPFRDMHGSLARRPAKGPLARLGSPDEVASIVEWLCSEECSFSTGALFDVTGGRGSW